VDRGSSPILGRGKVYEGPVREVVRSSLSCGGLGWLSFVATGVGVAVCAGSTGFTDSSRVARVRLAGLGTVGRDARPACAYFSGNFVRSRSRRSVGVLPCSRNTSSLAMETQEGPCSRKPLSRA